MFEENLVYFANKIFLYMCNSYLNEKKMERNAFTFMKLFICSNVIYKNSHFSWNFLYELLFFTMPSKLCIFCQGRVFWRCCDLFLCKMLNAYLDKRMIFFSQLYFSGLGLTQAMNANLLFIFSKTRNKCTFRHAKC